LGVPTIVTEATNVAEYIREFNAGIAIADDDVTALLGAIQQLYTSFKNDEMSTFAQGAKKMLEQVFAWPVLVEKYDALYRP
jgi:glycosyltransferase involved in cell wall biosynthesis